MTADDIQLIIFKKEIEETPLEKLLDEYEQYIKLRSTDLFEGRIALIRLEIKERCEKAAGTEEKKGGTVIDDVPYSWDEVLAVDENPPSAAANAI